MSARVPVSDPYAALRSEQSTNNARPVCAVAEILRAPRWPLQLENGIMVLERSHSAAS